jgi:hypothetical protein
LRLEVDVLGTPYEGKTIKKTFAPAALVLHENLIVFSSSALSSGAYEKNFHTVQSSAPTSTTIERI